MHRLAITASIVALFALPKAARAQSSSPPPSDGVTTATSPVTPELPVSMGPSPAPLAPPPTLPVTQATAPLSVAGPNETDYSSPFELTAGWHNDLFFISDRSHRWFIVPSGRLQLDFYGFTGDRITDASSGVRDTFVLRRARIEILGGFLDRFTYQLAAEFNNSTTPIAADLIIDGRVCSGLHLQLGQFDAPFTMENRTSDKYLDFIERSLAVRALGMPNNKEIGLMAWGELPSRLIYYSLGIFNGDGQNRLNRDNYFDGIARVFAHPFILHSSVLQDLQVGASFRYGFRGQTVDYAYPTMTSQQGFTFFNSQRTVGGNTYTIVPDSEQIAVAAEIDWPVNRFDVRAEWVYVRNGTAEINGVATDTARLAGSASRLGTLSGFGYYVQLGYWIWGTPGVNGRPGYENPPALRLNERDRGLEQGVQLVARLDVLDFHYDGGARGSIAPGSSTADGHYEVYAAEFGANYWLTKHIRFSVNYLEYFFPDQPSGASLMTSNRAHGPLNNDSAYGELTLRLGLAL